MEGNLPPNSYSVVKDMVYCGEIRVGLTFTPEVTLAELHQLRSRIGDHSINNTPRVIPCFLHGCRKPALEA